jgi:hypothetical protein
MPISGSLVFSTKLGLQEHRADVDGSVRAESSEMPLVDPFCEQTRSPRLSRDCCGVTKQCSFAAPNPLLIGAVWREGPEMR